MRRLDASCAACAEGVRPAVNSWITYTNEFWFYHLFSCSYTCKHYWYDTRTNTLDIIVDTFAPHLIMLARLAFIRCLPHTYTFPVMVILIFYPSSPWKKAALCLQPCVPVTTKPGLPICGWLTTITHEYIMLMMTEAQTGPPLVQCRISPSQISRSDNTFSHTRKIPI